MSNEIKIINVEGMSCSHCEAIVKNAVEALNGVESVSVSLKDKKITVEYDSEKVELQTIKDTIEDQGFTTH